LIDAGFAKPIASGRAVITDAGMDAARAHLAGSSGDQSTSEDSSRAIGPCVAYLLRLHTIATQPSGKRLPAALPTDEASADELRDACLAVRIPAGVFLTVAGVARAREMKGDVPTPLAELMT
jgi:hypothetical protein